MMKLEIVLSPGTFVYDKKELRAALVKAGREVANNAKALILSSMGAGRHYGGSGGGAKYRGYKAGGYSASAPGMPPVSLTGSLGRSMKVTAFKSGEGVEIRDNMYYALMLEAGAVGGIGTGRGGSNLSTRKANPDATINREGKRNVRARRGGKSVVTQVIGKRVLAPRPFLSVALSGNERFIDDRLRAAVYSGLGWKRQAAA